MRDVTQTFANIYLPHTALIILKNAESEAPAFVEAYDMNEEGMAINRRRLSLNETGHLANRFNASNELRADYLVSKGVLPPNVLHIKPRFDGYAIWHTPAKKVNLLFSSELGIADGEACVPPLVWKATQKKLQLFALKTSKRPDAKTPLYFAPFFNVRMNESICMGTVDVNMHRVNNLEKFMEQWENYFYNSYFSHAHAIEAPIKGSLINLWQELVQTKEPFPTNVLKKNGKTINDLIV
jgi:PRTRC genetic system protein B